MVENGIAVLAAIGAVQWMRPSRRYVVRCGPDEGTWRKEVRKSAVLALAGSPRLESHLTAQAFVCRRASAGGGWWCGVDSGQRPS